MKVLLSWLREFSPLDDDPAALAHTLSMLGTTVESMDRIGDYDENIVVGRVTDLRRHPKAERVQRVRVEIGGGESVEVWCGAFNMEIGDRVPLARVGTVMPDGREIGRRRILGEYSDGMLCSPAELELGGDGSGILILPEHAEPGVPLAVALGIESDVLYDLEVNPNRPDAMSVAGVARDLAAGTGCRSSCPTLRRTTAGEPATASASVEIVDPDLCGRFTSWVLRGIELGPSPAKVANRLTLLGMRPINNVVDASNYVMLELGQPSHPYDGATLPGGALRVRRARDGETMTTLDDVERRFTADDLLICRWPRRSDRHRRDHGRRQHRDLRGDDATSSWSWRGSSPWPSPRPAGASASAARHRPVSRGAAIRGSSSAPLVASSSCSAPSGGALAPGFVDARGELPEPAASACVRAGSPRIIGTEIPTEEIAGHLTRIGFEVTPTASANGDVEALDVIVPSFRPDTTTEIDVIEEVARHHGYERIVPTLPPSAHVGSLTAYQRDRRAVRRAMVGLGFAEAMPLPFLAPGDHARAGLTDDPLVITNPLVAEESVLRTSLLPGLLKAIAFNESHRNHRSVAVRDRPRLPSPARTERAAGRTGVARRGPRRS